LDPETKRVYGGLTAEERREERRRRLLDAGLEVMGTDGWSATTVRGVCERARLSARFFYESFADLNELAVAVFDEITASAFGRALEAMDDVGADPHARIRAWIETIVTELSDDPRRGRFAFIEALGSVPLMKRRLATMRSIAEIIATEIAHASQVPTNAEFVQVTSIGLAGALTELMIVWQSGELALPREQLIENLVELFATNVQTAATIANRSNRQTPPAPARR